MKILIKIIYLALIVMLFSCKEDAINPEEEFTLNFGETKSFSLHSISFTELKSDSRCPESLVCIWGGQAVVSIELTHKVNGSTSFELVEDTLQAGQQATAEWEDYTIELLSVDPYPRLTKPGKKRIIRFG